MGEGSPTKFHVVPQVPNVCDWNLGIWGHMGYGVATGFVTSTTRPELLPEPAKVEHMREPEMKEDLEPNETQLFSDSGKNGKPFWGRPFLAKQPPKKRKTGATEQLRKETHHNINWNFKTK